MAEHRIFLGVLDEECSSSKCGFSVTKIGGHPDWPQEYDRFWPNCSFCDERLSLAVQINCPLDNDSRDRTLFVFVCANLVCQRQLRKRGLSEYECGYWLAVRICKDSGRNERCGQVSKMQSDEWGTEQEDWDIDDADSSTSNAHISDNLTSQFGAISLQNAVPSGEAMLQTSEVATEAQCDSVERSNARRFGCYFISVVDEHEAIRSYNAESERHIQKLLTDYRLSAGAGSDLSRAEEFEETDEQGSKRTVQFASEPYEKSTIFSRDAAYRRFLKRIKAFPSQLVRYDVDSRSAMSSNAVRDASLHTTQRFVDCVAPRCAFCGAARVFEFQILSTLIAVMNEPNDELPTTSKDGSSNEMSGECVTDNCKAVLPDFGTAIIYTCERSCWFESEADRTAANVSPLRAEHILVEPESTI